MDYTFNYINRVVDIQIGDSIDYKFFQFNLFGNTYKFQFDKIIISNNFVIQYDKTITDSGGNLIAKESRQVNRNDYDLIYPITTTEQIGSFLFKRIINAMLLNELNVVCFNPLTGEGFQPIIVELNVLGGSTSNLNTVEINTYYTVGDYIIVFDNNSGDIIEIETNKSTEYIDILPGRWSYFVQDNTGRFWTDDILI